MIKKISLVTGASSGLGRILAELLCEKNHKVYVTARRKNLLEQLKKGCSNFDGKIIIISGDLSEEKFRERLIKTILKKEGRIDYLFNNAGFGRAIKFENMVAKNINKMFEINVVAYEHLAKLVLPRMKKLNKGRIINTGSVVAFTPLPYFAVYNSTKAAVYSFNRSLRYELKDSKVTTTVVLPARMKTGFADVAYDCYQKSGKEICVAIFNKSAGSPYVVAKNIIQNMDNGYEVITPTFKAELWYTMRYFGFIVDFVMKNIIGPKQLRHLPKIKSD